MKITIETVDELSRVRDISEALGHSKTDGYFALSEENLKKGERMAYIVMCDGQDAGYCFLNKAPKYAPYKRFGIYEIQDLNVLHDFRQKGLASALVESCEGVARQDECAEFGISVGLSADYGPAQRLYCKLGYLPDGQGITYDRQTLKHGDSVTLDDDLCLMMVKVL